VVEPPEPVRGHSSRPGRGAETTVISKKPRLQSTLSVSAEMQHNADFKRKYFTAEAWAK
jgi:hypothetical protein